jgi:hypothetical protein
MTAQKTTTMPGLYAALVAWLRRQRTESVTEVKPDPAVIARIRAYMARTMPERYGKHGPP